MSSVSLPFSADLRESPPLPSAAGFSVRVKPDRELVWVAPVGELDLATVPALDQQVQALIEVGFGHLVIDLRHLSFIDLTGVRLLLGLAEQARRDGWRLSLIPGDNSLRRVFALTNAIDGLPFCSLTALASA